MIRGPPRSKHTYPLVPYTTLFRSPSIQFTERLGQCPCQSLAHLNVHLMAEMVGLDVVSAPCLHVLLERHIKLLSERDGTSEHDHTLSSFQRLKQIIHHTSAMLTCSHRRVRDQRVGMQHDECICASFASVLRLLAPLFSVPRAACFVIALMTADPNLQIVSRSFRERVFPNV